MGDSLKAGRDLDFIIHEKVMGLCVHDFVDDSKQALQKDRELFKEEYGSYPPDKWEPWDWHERRPLACSKCDRKWDDPISIGPSLGHIVRYYSTDIQDMWKVIKKMRQIWSEQQNAKAGEPDRWLIADCAEEGWQVIIEWLHHDGPLLEVEVIDPSLPKAICLAALEYMERQNEP